MSLQRTAPLKRAASKRKTSPLRAADEFFSKLVRERDGFCLNCGYSGGVAGRTLQAAHIWSRRYRSLRWKLENCITLCSGCHMGFTYHPAEFAVWAEERRFCEAGICSGPDGGHGQMLSQDHMFNAYTYLQLRHRALNDPSEKPKEALSRLRTTTPETA